jgi:hypothetical protein
MGGGVLFSRPLSRYMAQDSVEGGVEGKDKWPDYKVDAVGGLEGSGLQ